MNLGHAVLFGPLVIGVILDAVNAYLYVLSISNSLKKRPGQPRRRVPSAMPFASLPLYVIYIVFVVIAYTATKKPLVPLGIELKIGLICLLVHILIHIAFLFVIPLLVHKELFMKNQNSGVNKNMSE